MISFLFCLYIQSFLCSPSISLRLSHSFYMEFYFGSVLYNHIFSIHPCTSELPAVAMACMNCFYLLLFESMVFSILFFSSFAFFFPWSYFRQCAFFILQFLAYSPLRLSHSYILKWICVFYLLLRIYLCALLHAPIHTYIYIFL